MAAVRLTKAQAYGNDFVFVPAVAARALAAGDFGRLARTICDRHLAVGADGLILYTLSDRSATMELFNADGSPSELSGNGLRCLAALVARIQALEAGAQIEIKTGAGTKALDLLHCEGERYTFRAALGPPTELRQTTISVLGETLTVSILRMGNPQCVVLGPLPDAARFNRLGPVLATHPMFPSGTNVEFAHVEAPDRVRILIWERGVGPTSSSGTGASAAAVAAAAHGGAARELDIISPGGTQRVEWTPDGVYLTGWAEVVLECDWLGAP